MKKIFSLYREAFSGLSREIWLLSIVLFVNRAGTMVLPFLALYLTGERGYSVTVAGQILGVYGAGAIVGAYGGGFLSDRIGALRTQKLSLLLSAGCYLLLGYATALTHILLAVFATSVTAEAFRPASMTAATQFSTTQNRTRALALMRLMVNVAMSIGPAIGGLLALYNYFWLFVVDAATSFAAFIFAVIVLAPRKTKLPPLDPIGPAGDRSPWRDGPFLLLLVLLTMVGCVYLQTHSTFPIYMKKFYGLNEAHIGLLFVVNTMIIVIFEMLLIKKIETKNLMQFSGIGAVLACIGFALMPFGRTILYAALTVSIWTIGEMLVFPLVNAIVGHRAGPKYRGRYMGLYTISFSVSILAPLVGTAIYEKIGPDALWFIIGGLGLFLGLAFRALAPFFPNAVNPPTAKTA